MRWIVPLRICTRHRSPVNAASFVDLFEDWDVFFKAVQNLKFKVPLKVVKVMGASKDEDGKSIFDHLGAVEALSKIRNVSKPPEGELRTSARQVACTRWMGNVGFHGRQFTTGQSSTD